MRIAIFSDSWYPYISGVVRSIEIFKQELEKREHIVHLFAPAYPKTPEDGERVYRFFSLPAVANPGFRVAVPISPRLSSLLKSISVDIVHCQSPMMMGRAGMSCSRRLDLPLVFTHHTLYDLYTHYAGPLAGPATRYLTNYVRGFANRSDLVITPTKVVAERLAGNGVTAPLKAVPTGVVLEEFENCDRSWLRRNLNLEDDQPIILCVARLGLEKNIYLLLESFALISQHLPAAHLALVGLGPLAKKLPGYAQSLGVGKKFHLFDREFSREEMANIYASADLFLYPSVTETQGIIINEAQAAGLPVVAVGAYGVAEMVEDGIDGILTKPEPEPLAKAVVEVLTDEGLRKKLEQGALKAARRITAGEMAEKMIEAYKLVLSRAD